VSRFFVTGAAGFIGSHLAERLLAQGHDVRCVDCFTDYYDPGLKRENAASLDVLELDLAADDFDLRDVDCVFHLAGQPGTRSFGPVFADYLRRNTLATQRVFETAVAVGVKVVYASSSSVYGDAESYPTTEATIPRPNSPYGITKLACEHLAAAYGRSFGLDAVGLRYFTVYGPRQRPDMAFARIVGALVEGASFELFGDGGQSRSFTFVDDVVEATVAAATAEAGSLYNVGGGAESNMLAAIDLLESVSGRKLDLRSGASARGDMRRTMADTTTIGRDLGWQATTSLEDGLRAQWEWALARARGW